MVKNILNLEGVTVLTKQQQKMVNGGKKCQYMTDSAGNIFQDGLYENDGTGTGTYNGGAVANQCYVRCRPSFLGIGLGSWSDWEAAPC